MKPIDLRDELFQGAVSLERTPDGVKPWRIHHREYELFPPNGIGGRAEIPAGVRLRLASDTSALGLRVVPSDQERPFDCVVDGTIRETFALAPGQADVAFRGLPAGDKTIELYLPVNQPVTVTGLELDDSAAFRTPEDLRPRWIAYGSSITQCASAASPAETWPAIVARERRLHLTCLGFSGNCHLEPMVARMIRDRPADLISCCLGINVYGSATYSPRTFRAAVIGFLQIVREKHRLTPIVVSSPIVSPPRESKENAVGFTLAAIRAEVEAAVDALRRHGDDNLYYLNGLDWFGPEFADYLPDQLHPNAEGYRIMARRLRQWLEANVPLPDGSSTN